MTQLFRKFIIVSIGAHILLFGLLLVSVDFERITLNQPESGPIINASVISSEQLTTEVNRLKQLQADKTKLEQQRIADLERKAQEARQKRLDQEKQLKQLELETKQREEVKRKADEAAVRAQKQRELEQKKAEQAKVERLKQEQERKAAELAAAEAAKENARQQELARKAREEKAQVEEAQRVAEDNTRKAEEASRRAEVERQKKEKALKEAVEAEHKAQVERERQEAQRAAEEAEKVRQQAAEAEMIAAMEAESSSRQQQKILGEVQKFQAMITATIQRNVIIDSSLQGKSCNLTVTLSASGFITNVTGASGDATACRAAETAVYKTAQVPVSKEPDIFEQMRVLNLTLQLGG